MMDLMVYLGVAYVLGAVVTWAIGYATNAWDSRREARIGALLWFVLVAIALWLALRDWRERKVAR